MYFILKTQYKLYTTWNCIPGTWHKCFRVKINSIVLDVYIFLSFKWHMVISYQIVFQLSERGKTIIVLLPCAGLELQILRNIYQCLSHAVYTLNWSKFVSAWKTTLRCSFATESLRNLKLHRHWGLSDWTLSVICNFLIPLTSIASNSTSDMTFPKTWAPDPERVSLPVLGPLARRRYRFKYIESITSRAAAQSGRWERP